MVRLATTLGTPLTGSLESTNAYAWRVFELTSGRNAEVEVGNFDLGAAPLVPTTSIYSRTDGIVAWQCSIQTKVANNPHTENVVVIASHLGIGVNPSA